MDGAVRTPLGEMWVEDGLLWHRLDTSDVITEDDAQKVIAAVAELTNGEPMPSVVDISGIGFATAAARRKFGGSIEQSLESATAIIVGNTASRLMAQAFLAVSKPKRPVAVFTDSTQAAEWATGFRED